MKKAAECAQTPISRRSEFSFVNMPSKLDVAGSSPVSRGQRQAAGVQRGDHGGGRALTGLAPQRYAVVCARSQADARVGDARDSQAS